MDDKILVALVGFVGTVIGSIVTIAGQILTQWLKDRTKARANRARKEVLIRMLESGREWRNLSTLMHVIGANEETTKQLLLEIGARASEDGQPLWALIKNKPLPTIQ